MEFIQNNWLSLVIIAIVTIVFFVWLVWQIKKKGLRQTVIDLIVEAEKIYNTQSGQTKKQYVIKKIYNLLPSIFRIFISEEMIDNLVQKIFDEIKKVLDYRD